MSIRNNDKKIDEQSINDPSPKKGEEGYRETKDLHEDENYLPQNKKWNIPWGILIFCGVILILIIGLIIALQFLPPAQ